MCGAPGGDIYFDTLKSVTAFFFPCLLLIPKFEGASLTSGNMVIRKRLWDTTTFDLATLATKHILHLPYQLIDIFLRSCNLEIEVNGHLHHADAFDEMQMLRTLLYLRGVSAFMIPFVTTHSINDYSGINSRDSDLLAKKLPEALKHGLTSAEGKLEAWYCDRTWTLIHHVSSLEIGEDCFTAVISQLDTWKAIEKEYPIVNIVRRLFNFAPMIPDDEASILQMWQGIESLFPSIQSEVTFRLALLISQLCCSVQARRTTYKEAKVLYKTRSQISHGAGSKVDAGDWTAAWALMRLCLRAVLVRGKLPTEEELMSELMPE